MPPPRNTLFLIPPLLILLGILFAQPSPAFFLLADGHDLQTRVAVLETQMTPHPHPIFQTATALPRRTSTPSPTSTRMMATFPPTLTPSPTRTTVPLPTRTEIPIPTPWPTATQPWWIETPIPPPTPTQETTPLILEPTITFEVVAENGVNLRHEPSLNGQILATLRGLTTVEMTNEMRWRDGWVWRRAFAGGWLAQANFDGSQILLKELK